MYSAETHLHIWLLNKKKPIVDHTNLTGFLFPVSFSTLTLDVVFNVFQLFFVDTGLRTEPSSISRAEPQIGGALGISSSSSSENFSSCRFHKCKFCKIDKFCKDSI